MTRFSSRAHTCRSGPPIDLYDRRPKACFRAPDTAFLTENEILSRVPGISLDAPATSDWLNSLESDFSKRYQTEASRTHWANVERAARMIESQAKRDAASGRTRYLPRHRLRPRRRPRTPHRHSLRSRWYPRTRRHHPR